MHELSFAEQVLERVQAAAAPYGGCRVTRVRLSADADLALDPAALCFCLEGIAAGTAVAGARLEVEEAPTARECAQCGREGAPGADACADCGGPLRRTRAMGITIEEIELDDSQTAGP